MRRALVLEGEVLRVGEEEIALGSVERVRVVGAGPPLQVTTRTVEHDWQKARVWLHTQQQAPVTQYTHPSPAVRQRPGWLAAGSWTWWGTAPLPAIPHQATIRLWQRRLTSPDA